jgi:predicted transcriptional regulator
LGMKRRNSFSIAFDIVSACRKSSSKTHVVYLANLNSVRVNEYLDVCLSLGLINAEKTAGGQTVYRTTESGLRFLKNHSEVVAEEAKNASKLLRMSS